MPTGSGVAGNGRWHGKLGNIEHMAVIRCIGPMAFGTQITSTNDGSHFHTGSRWRASTLNATKMLLQPNQRAVCDAMHNIDLTIYKYTKSPAPCRTDTALGGR